MPSSASSPPDVSFIVPMHESAATVEATLHSIRADLDASKVTGEVLVVNDGSRDDGPRLVGRLAAEDRRIRLLSQANRGLAGARNTGLEHARGRFVRFLDADDLAAPGGTACLITAAAETGAACGAHALIDGSGRSLGRTCPAIGGADGRIGLDELLTGNRMGVGAVLLDRARLGPLRFDAAASGCEDWDLWLRLAAAGLRWSIVPSWSGSAGVVKHYRVRRGSMSKDYLAMFTFGADVLRRAFARLGSKNDPRQTAVLRFHALAYGTMQALSAQVPAPAMLGCIGGTGPALDPRNLASAALWGVLLGLGIRPDERGPEQDEWLHRLNAWWEELDASRSGTLPAAAFEQLAHLVVSPATIAAECVRRFPANHRSGIVVVGLGQNGLALVEALENAGIDFRACDDRLTGPLSAGLDPALAARMEPMNTPIPHSAVIVLTPSDDAALVQRLAPGTSAHTVIRWSRVHGDLARAEARSMAAALNPAPAHSS